MSGEVNDNFEELDFEEVCRVKFDLEQY